MSDAVLPSSALPAARPHAVKLNVLASWLAHGMALAIGFFLMPYVLKVLGDHQYGTWVFINSFVAYAGILYLGFGETISRYVAKYEAEQQPERVNEVVNLILAVYASMSLVALALAGVAYLVVPWFDRWEGHELVQVQWVILILGVNLAVSLCGSVFGGVLLGLRRFDLERAVGVIFDFLRVALVFLFLTRTWGLVTIAAIFLIVTACEQLLTLYFAFRVYPALRIHPRYLKWSVLKECSGFSGMAMVSQIASFLIHSTDSVVIGLMLGAEAIVPYYIALRLTQFIKQPIDKIAHICMPTAGALGAETDRRRLLNFLTKSIGVVVLLIGGMFIGGWFFGGHLIRAWMGTQYEESHQILCILLGAQLVALPCGILRAFLFGTGNVRGPGLIFLLEAVLNLVLSIALCWQWEAVGVAWGTFIPAVGIELGILLPYALRTLGLPLQRLIRDALLPQLPPLILLAFYAWSVSSQTWSQAGWPALIGITLGGGGVLAASWLLQHRAVPRLAR